MYIDQIYCAFNSLKNTSSRLEKEALLRTYGEDEDFKSVLKFLLDPMVVTGISDKRINKDTCYGYYEEESYDFDVCYLLDWIKEHNTGRDSDLAYIQHYIQKITDDEDIQEFIKSIITKSFRAGVDVKTCQKIYGKDFIKTLDVMLGTSIENTTIPEGCKIFISQKLNGTRCFLYKGHLYTRQGKEYVGCNHILDDLNRLLAYYPGDYVIDGELVLKDCGLGDSEAFQQGAGLANSKSADKSDLKLVIFDVLPVIEFEAGVSKKLYSARSDTLESFRFQIHRLGIHNLDVVRRFYAGNDHSEIFRWLDYAEANDMEGVMINLDTPYECKRTKNLIKVKKFYTLDLLVTGLEKGTGRNSNRLGKVIVDFKGNDVGVGSGFSDEQRDYFWEHPDEIVGRVIEVKYKEITKNKDNDKESLQFPVFIQIREDGKEVSYD